MACQSKAAKIIPLENSPVEDLHLYSYLAPQLLMARKLLASGWLHCGTSERLKKALWEWGGKGLYWDLGASCMVNLGFVFF